VLSPATLPWYLSWGMALLAMVAWSRRGLTAMVFVSLMLIIVYYPNGEDALYNWPYLLACALVAALAAVSLHRPDPLRLAAGARGKRGTAAAPVDAAAGDAPAAGTTTADTTTADTTTADTTTTGTSTAEDGAARAPEPRAAGTADGEPTPPSPAGASAGAEQRAG